MAVISLKGLRNYGFDVRDGKVRYRVTVRYLEMPKKFYRDIVRNYLELESKYEEAMKLVLLIGEYARKASIEAEINKAIVHRLESEMAAMMPRYVHLLKSNRYLRNRVEDLMVEAHSKEDMLKTYEELNKRLVNKIRESDVFVDINKAVEVARRAIRHDTIR